MPVWSTKQTQKWYFWVWDQLWAPLILPKLVTSIWNRLEPTYSILNYCSNHFYPLWILDCTDKARQKCKINKKTMILEEYLDFHTARNQGRWSMPKLKISQFCAMMIRRKCAKFQAFLKLSTWLSQPAKFAHI